MKNSIKCLDHERSSKNLAVSKNRRLNSRVPTVFDNYFSACNIYVKEDLKLLKTINMAIPGIALMMKY